MRLTTHLSSAKVKNEWSCTLTSSLCLHTGPVLPVFVLPYTLPALLILCLCFITHLLPPKPHLYSQFLCSTQNCPYCPTFWLNPLQSSNIHTSLFLSHPLSWHFLCEKPCPPTLASHIVPLTNSLPHLLMLIHKETNSRMFHIFFVPHLCLCNFWFFLSRTSISSPNLLFVLPLIHAYNHYSTQKLWFSSIIYACYSSYISVCCFYLQLLSPSSLTFYYLPVPYFSQSVNRLFLTLHSQKL
jgi:hypothetical protein